ncbi:MAG: RHS repeat-associated core domain-containing protein [Bacteroidales bacterium]
MQTAAPAYYQTATLIKPVYSEKNGHPKKGVNYSYFGARYYDSDLSVWLSMDPMSDKYPQLSPYNYCALNPLIYIDPTGMIIDPAGSEENSAYNDYRKEINARIDVINDKMSGLDKSSDEYSKLNIELISYNQINTELDALEKDQNNVYHITFGVEFSGGTEGRTYYNGQTTCNGKEMRQINIDMSDKTFPMSNLAHEFKHAYQYYEGRLAFFAGSQGGANSKEFEREAFERGNRFHGNTQINNSTFNLNYKYNNELPDAYKDLIESAPLNQVKYYANKQGLTLIINGK